MYIVQDPYISKGFEISAQGELTVTGEMQLNEHNLMINTKGSLWMLGNSIKVGEGISFFSKKELYLAPNYYEFENNIKPDKMPQEDWESYINLLFDRGFFQ